MWNSKLLLAAASAAAVVDAAPTTQNGTYTNPIIPGYRPDPSCVSVEGIFYCISSSFNNFPGIPVHASKDLINWRHVSNAIHREEDVPEYSQISANATTRGVYAPTIRYNDGYFYIINTFMSDDEPFYHLIVNSTDPLTPGSWNAPVKFFTDEFSSFDPDLFFDDDGQVYATTHVFSFAGNNIFPVDVTTGQYGDPVNIWNGTGGVWPEAPHVYRKDDYYWTIIAEGGTGPNHMVNIARSRDVYGPYESYDGNPILTNANTTEFFQAVGHADFFQDLEGNWWGVALSIRRNDNESEQAYPMGRETVLFPITWEENEWPVLQPVRGEMSGPLPPPSRDIPGNGPWVLDGDDYYFEGDEVPLHFLFWKLPPPDMYEIADGALVVHPSYYNLTGDLTTAASDRIAYVGRRQTDTLFKYFVDMEYTPEAEGEEAGVTLFGVPEQHVDIGVVYENGVTSVRMRATFYGASNETDGYPGFEVVVELPEEMHGETVRLQIEGTTPREYLFSFGPSDDDAELHPLGTVYADILSEGEATFVGSTLGVFASANGGEGTAPATFTRWYYEGRGQQIDHERIIASGSHYGN
jgi:beta-xylosidase